MMYGVYQSAAAMMSHEYRQDVTANNIANADTVGFKREIATLIERQTAANQGDRDGATNDFYEALTGGVWLGKTVTDYSEANLIRTEQETDVALTGPGFFMVQDGDQQLLTRDGRFTQRADGLLVSVADGAPLLGVGGIPIRSNPQGGPLRIDEVGRVYQNNAPIAQLAVVDVADYEALKKTGEQRFLADDAGSRPSPAHVRQGYVESSGVQPVKEMVTMLETSRAHNLNAQMLRMQDGSLSQLLGLLTRL